MIGGATIAAGAVEGELGSIKLAVRKEPGGRLSERYAPLAYRNDSTI